jgi:hypothetical protein
MNPPLTVSAATRGFFRESALAAQVDGNTGGSAKGLVDAPDRRGGGWPAVVSGQGGNGGRSRSAADERKLGTPVHAASWKSIVAAGGGFALSFLLVPSTASAAGASNVVPVTSYAVASTQCDGPTYLPVLNPALEDVYSELDALVGSRPGQGPFPPTFSSCSPLPAAASPVVGSASASSVASPNGSATVSAQALGNEFVAESSDVDTTLTGSVTLASAAPSVTFSVPYSTSGLSLSGNPEDAFALISFSAGAGSNCVDGSYGIWSVPPGQYDLSAPMAPGSGTASVQLFCPDGSDLAPGAVSLTVTLLVNAASSDSQNETASADIALNGVTATINS